MWNHSEHIIVPNNLWEKKKKKKTIIWCNFYCLKFRNIFLFMLFLIASFRNDWFFINFSTNKISFIFWKIPKIPRRKEIVSKSIFTIYCSIDYYFGCKAPLLRNKTLHVITSNTKCCIGKLYFYTGSMRTTLRASKKWSLLSL